FNWEAEFPEAFAGKERGFHIIIGNPPWDKTKFEDPLFFAQYRSNYRSLPESRKKEIATDLLDKPHIAEAYEEQRQKTRVVNECYKASYPRNAGAGDGNLFRFLVERNLDLLAPGGTLNYVLPTGLLTEDGSIALRKHIFDEYRIVAFDGFENRLKIFPDVDSRYKFGLIQIERAQDALQSARMRFMLTDPQVLDAGEGVFEYSLDDVKATSPEHLAYMETRNGHADLDMLKRAYRIFPRLDPDWLDFRRELDATNDKAIFLEKNAPGLLPLYKGASIWQYDGLFGKPEYWLDPAAFDAHLLEREISRLIDDIYLQLPGSPKNGRQEAVLKALDLSRREELAAFVQPDRKYFRLGFRDIASDTNERTLIAAVLPPSFGAQNKLPVSIPKRYCLDAATRTIGVKETPLSRLFFAQALFNSLPVDWILRFSVAITVNKTYLTRLPLPQPGDAELRDNPAYAELCRNSLRLSLFHNPGGFQALQDLFGIADKDIPATPKQADALRVRNDHLVARLYGVSKAEFAHLLSSFAVLRKKRPEYARAVVQSYADHD
ncbi:MAG: restriction endonuclease, partial [Deltaproteobacteria bacterium]|nr:restriction endonuclease [Deltaproteobacteria bacterium]